MALQFPGIISSSGEVTLISSLPSVDAIQIITTDPDGGIVISDGGGGIDIAGSSSSGDVNIANGTASQTVFIGNNNSNSKVFIRCGTGGRFFTQLSHVSLPDSDNNISVGDLFSGILSGAPSVDRLQTLPDAGDIVSLVDDIQVDDAFDFHFINNSTTDGAEWVLNMGSGGIMEGNPRVSPSENITNSYKNAGTARFLLRMTNVTLLSEAYIVYRLG